MYFPHSLPVSLHVGGSAFFWKWVKTHTVYLSLHNWYATNQLQGSFWISMWELHREVSETPIRSAIFDLCFHFINKQLGGGNTALTIYQIVSDRQQGNGCECGGESIFGTTNKIGYIFLWHYLPRADSVWLRMTVEYQGKQAPYLHGACLLISAIVLLPWAWSDTSI